MIHYKRLDAKTPLKAEELKVKIPYTILWYPKMDMPTIALRVFADPYKKIKGVGQVTSTDCFMLVNPPINIFDYRLKTEILDRINKMPDGPSKTLYLEQDVKLFHERNSKEKDIYALQIIGTDVVGYLQPTAEHRFFEASPEDDDEYHDPES